MRELIDIKVTQINVYTQDQPGLKGFLYEARFIDRSKDKNWDKMISFLAPSLSVGKRRFQDAITRVLCGDEETIAPGDL